MVMSNHVVVHGGGGKGSAGGGARGGVYPRIYTLLLVEIESAQQTTEIQALISGSMAAQGKPAVKMEVISSEEVGFAQNMVFVPINRIEDVVIGDALTPPGVSSTRFDIILKSTEAAVVKTVHSEMGRKAPF